MRRKINRRFLVCLLAVLAVLAVGIHFLHAFQVRRNIGILLRQADRAEKDQRPAKVLTYLRPYLAYDPRNAEVHARYAYALEKQAAKTGSQAMRQKAYLEFEAALRLYDPDKSYGMDFGKVRRHQLEFALASDIQRYGDARRHLEALKEAARGRAAIARIEEQLGRCYEAEKRYKDAAAPYEAAKQLRPDKLGLYEKLARLYHERLQDSGKAGRVMNDLVKANATKAEAWVARARYRMRYEGHGAKAALALGQAESDLTKAGRIAANDPEVLLAGAELARLRAGREGQQEPRQRLVQHARDLLEKGLKEHPQRPEFYRALVDLEVKEQRPARALEIIRTGLVTLKGLADPDGQLQRARGDLMWLQGGLLIEQGRPAKLVRAVLAQLGKSEYPKPLVELLEARLLVRSREWGAALKRLQALRDDFQGKPPAASSVAQQRKLLMAHCQQQLGYADQALATYREAVGDDPLSFAARLGTAAALMEMGQYSEAVTEFRTILEFPQAPPAVRVYLAQALMAQNARLRPAERNWAEPKELLEGAPNSPEAAIQYAYLLVQEDPNKIGEARARLQKKLKTQGDEPALWVALADLEAWREKPRQALRVLKGAERSRPELAGRVELHLARVRYLSQLPDKDNSEARAGLSVVEKDLGQLPAADRQRLLSGLGSAYYLAGAREAAERMWKRLVREQPNHLGVRLLLFDLARERGDRRAMERLTREMGELGDKGGKAFYGYQKATALVDQASRKGAGADERARLLDEARRQLAGAARYRRSWYRLVALEGVIDDLQNRPEQAVERFQYALRLGDRRLAIVRRLVDLLKDAGRYDEAEQIVSGLVSSEGALSRLPDELKKAAAEVLVSAHRRDKVLALKLAVASISPSSRDYRDHLWLARFRLLLDKPEETAKAKESMRRALQLAGKNPDVWVAWVLFLVDTKQVDEAKEAVRQAQNKLPAKANRLALAYCYELTGQTGAAEKKVQAALADRPADPATLQSAAGFYLRNNRLGQAQGVLERLLAADAGKVRHMGARRTLARILARSPAKDSYQKALALIDENLKVGGKADRELDQRVQALLLATRLDGRQKAIRLYKGFARLSADERFTLVQLYEANNQWADARRNMLLLLARPEGKKAAYVVYYIRGLLKRNQVAEAEAQLERLDGLEKAGRRTWQTVAARASVLHAGGNRAEALELLRTYVATKGANLGYAAALLDDLGKRGGGRDYDKLAERLYVRHLGTGRPADRLLAYAGFLGRRHRVPEALTCCGEALQKGPAEQVLAVAVAVLRAGPAQPAQRERVHRWFEKALAKGTPSPALQISLADFYDFQGRCDDAIAVYRQILAKDEQQVLARNNLAWLLALRGDVPEALDEIERAVAQIGPAPELLDTRAVINLMAGHSSRAIQDLKECLKQSPKGSDELAIRLFHLAWAYALTTDLRSQAPEKFKEAKEAGFDVNRLHPLERREYWRVLPRLQ
jgi:tetratricopeptide (TPR) repeat protein